MSIKKLLSPFLVLALALSCLTVLPAATCAEAKKDVAMALQAADVACIFANALLPTVDAVAEACKIDKLLAPAIEQYLKEGVRFGVIAPKGAAAKWAPDAHTLFFIPHGARAAGQKLYVLRPKMG